MSYSIISLCVCVFVMLMNVSENGDFLALDLGGTNFRVLLCRMRSGHCESTSRNYNVPNHKLRGPASAVCLCKLLSFIIFVMFNLSHTALTVGMATGKAPGWKNSASVIANVPWFGDFWCCGLTWLDFARRPNWHSSRHSSRHSSSSSSSCCRRRRVVVMLLLLLLVMLLLLYACAKRLVMFCLWRYSIT